MPRRTDPSRPPQGTRKISAFKRGGRKPVRAAPSPASDQPQLARLQKALAAAGLGSRRQCEQLIVEGRVEVDRQTVTELGTRVDPTRQEIRVDGELLPRPKLRYYAVHKPSGAVTTNRDPAGRPRVIDLAPNNERLFPVGRLDLHSEGLILLTNDGELANQLAHPRFGVEKTYLAQVAGDPTPEVLAKLKAGVHLAEGFAHAKHVRVKSRKSQSSILEIVLDEGRNREVRRLLARVGHKVLRLRRIAFGPLRLGELPVGECRALSAEEVHQLRQASAAAAQEGPRRRGAPNSRRGPQSAGTEGDPGVSAEAKANIEPASQSRQPNRSGMAFLQRKAEGGPRDEETVEDDFGLDADEVLVTEDASESMGTVLDLADEPVERPVRRGPRMRPATGGRRPDARPPGRFRAGKGPASPPVPGRAAIRPIVDLRPGKSVAPLPRGTATDAADPLHASPMRPDNKPGGPSRPGRPTGSKPGAKLRAKKPPFGKPGKRQRRPEDGLQKFGKKRPSAPRKAERDGAEENAHDSSRGGRGRMKPAGGTAGRPATGQGRRPDAGGRSKARGAERKPNRKPKRP